MSEEKIKVALEAAKDKLDQLGIEEKLVSEIEWCLGSYSHDGNPEGLYEKGEEAVKALTKYKAKNDRKVSKKLITDLEKYLKA
ncbi:hypothetical protein [Marinoscillum sp. MHG1-6]|uniref:hypothetical protein n=1 Tax=Marinoscillum sp. MHG1-6 TaxID=2959627 RepID=UPI00215792E6|nr:hypothetical protein [Marinoscillum sp. MHG1-6]